MKKKYKKILSIKKLKSFFVFEIKSLQCFDDITEK